MELPYNGITIAIRYQIKTLAPAMGYLQQWVASQWSPQVLQNIATVLSYSLELSDKNLLWKKPCT